MPRIKVEYEIKTNESKITLLMIGNKSKYADELTRKPKGTFYDTETGKENEVYVRIEGGGKPGYKTEITLKVDGKILTGYPISLKPDQITRVLYFGNYIKWR